MDRRTACANGWDLRSRTERISPERAEHDLERGGAVLVRSMLTIARMTREEDRFVLALGREWYERILARAQWVPYLVIGKPEARVSRCARRSPTSGASRP